MNYSYSHERFANDLYLYHGFNEQDVLDSPRKYLGPHYKELLNFWFYYESLSELKMNNYCYKLNELAKNSYAHNTYENLNISFALEVIEPPSIYHLYDIELEIVAAHLYIQREIPFIYIPLIFDL